MDEAYSSLTRNLIREVLPVLLSDNVITVTPDRKKTLLLREMDKMHVFLRD